MARSDEGSSVGSIFNFVANLLSLVASFFKRVFSLLLDFVHRSIKLFTGFLGGTFFQLTTCHEEQCRSNNQQ